MFALPWSFRWRSHFYRGRSKHNAYTHSESFCSVTDVCLLKRTITFSARFIDRPEQRISLEDFKSFLLESQKVIYPSCWTWSLLRICFFCVLQYICVLCECRKCGLQITTRFRSLCSATWKTLWEKWSSLISSKTRYTHFHCLSHCPPPLFLNCFLALSWVFAH